MKWNAVVVMVVLALILSGCKSQVPDEVPAETGPQAEADLTVIDLLPKKTTVVASYQVEAFDELRRTSPLPREVVDRLVPAAPMLQGLLLGDGEVPGLDRAGAVYVAASREGFEATLEGLRIASPRLIEELTDPPYEGLAVRVIAPATDVELLIESIAEGCRALTGQLCQAEARGDFAVLDLVWTQAFRSWVPRVDQRAIEEGLTVENTAAWEAFMTRQAPVAAYAKMEGIFDQIAITDLVFAAQHIAYTNGESVDELVPFIVAKIAQELSFDSPEVAESEDVALFVSHDGSVVFFDAVASLTEYGRGLVDLIAEEALMRQRSLGEPLLDARWGLDLSQAIAETRKPLWASDIRGMEEATFARLLDGQVRESAWGFPLGVFRAPITGYALFDEFVGDQTTPAEFSLIRGFWLQIFGQEAGQIISAMGLQLPWDAPLEPFEQFATAALSPFGRPLTTQVVEREEDQEFQASTAEPVAEVFAEEEIAVEAGVNITVHLRDLAAMINAPELAHLVDYYGLLSFNFLAHLGAAELHLHAGFAEDQGLVRVQWGGEELVDPPFVEGAAAAVQGSTAAGEWVMTAREWSILALSELADLDAGALSDRQELISEIGDALTELAEECDDETQCQQVRGLVEDWRGLGVYLTQ